MPEPIHWCAWCKTKTHPDELIHFRATDEYICENCYDKYFDEEEHEPRTAKGSLD